MIIVAPFWHPFCSSIQFLGTLAGFGHHFGILLVILDPFSTEIKFSTPFSAEHLQNTDDTSNDRAFPLHSDLSHLGLERNLASGNLDPLRAQRRPRRVRICAFVLSACTLSAYLPSAFFVCLFLFFVLIHLIDLYAPRAHRQASALGPEISYLIIFQHVSVSIFGAHVLLDPFWYYFRSNRALASQMFKFLNFGTIFEQIAPCLPRC